MTPPPSRSLSADNDAPAMVDGWPEGMLEFELETNIKAAVALYGYEAAREMTAVFLNRTNDRIARR